MCVCVCVCVHVRLCTCDAVSGWMLHHRCHSPHLGSVCLSAELFVGGLSQLLQCCVVSHSVRHVLFHLAAQFVIYYYQVLG